MGRSHSRSATELWVRPGDWTWRSGGRDELCSLPACFPDLNVLWVPMGYLLELGAGTEQLVGGREFGEERRSVCSLGGGCSGEGRLQKVFDCRAGNGPWGLDLEEDRER